MVVQIFVEGKTDEKFVKDVLIHIGKYNASVLVIEIGGWNNLPKSENRFKEATNKGGKNLVIFDADLNIAAKRAAIEAIKTKLGIAFELFLFPNNSDPGCVETLIKRIVPQQYQDIFPCFDSYK